MANNNNNKPVPYYTKEYVSTFKTVFGVQAAFGAALAPLQILDGVAMNKTAFSVKTNNTPVVVGEYNESGDVNKGVNRFGDATEIIYADEDVPYDYTWAIHEMLDLFTVNNDPQGVITDRLILQAEAKTRLANKRIGKKTGELAGKKLEMAAITEEELHKVFNEVREYLRNLEVIAPVTAYVTPAVYTIYKELDKKSAANGFTSAFDVVEEAEQNFPADAKILFIPDGIVVPFVGVETVRTITSELHPGYNLQGAGKGGTFVIDDNKAAIVKVGVAPGA